jgi:hypothetical protein
MVSASQPNGLWKVAESTFVNAANPFINGCLSDDYDNYRIVMNLFTSAATTVRWRVRSGVSTVETGAVYDRFGFSVLAGVVSNDSFNDGNSSSLVGTALGSSELTPVVMDLMSPFKAVQTVAMPRSWNTNTGGQQFNNVRIQSTTQYTGIEIFLDSGTVSGSIRVYGYKD